MFTILLHSSKTTRQVSSASDDPQRAVPALVSDANILARYLQSLSEAQLQKAMQFSPAMAQKTRALVQSWDENGPTLPAIDLFLGDIYSGLQAQAFSQADRRYANEHLFILSGMYGVLRALDEIQPYRLEMGYKLPGNDHDTLQPNITSLYDFWADRIAKALPTERTIVNLSAVEYTKGVFPHFKNLENQAKTRIVTPKFLTVSPKTGEPAFVTVHAKVARGAFARWLIQNRIETIEGLKGFDDIGYVYAPDLSTDDEPVFVAKTFGGIGLSVRLT